MAEGKDVPSEFEVPEDALLIRRIGPWEFYFSKSDYSLFVVTTDYHSGPLKLSKDDLFEFMGVIEKHKEDVERDVTRELEEYMGTVIEKGKDRAIFKSAKIKLLLPENQNEAGEVPEETKKRGKRHR